MFQDEGASTDVTCTLDFARASMTGPNGSRTSPSKLKPIRSVLGRRMRRGWGRDTEDGIDDVVGVIEGRVEVFDEGDLEVLQLC